MVTVTYWKRTDTTSPIFLWMNCGCNLWTIRWCSQVNTNTKGYDLFLNYNNFDEETQQYLLSVSKEDIESRFGNGLKAFANKHNLDYSAILDEEAIKNLYSYQFVFNI